MKFLMHDIPVCIYRTVGLILTVFIDNTIYSVVHFSFNYLDIRVRLFVLFSGVSVGFILDSSRRCICYNVWL